MNVGDRVRVVRLDDTTADGSRRRTTGVVVGRIVNDHGATPKDPLLRVRFDADGVVDAFWETELEVVHGAATRR